MKRLSAFFTLPYWKVFIYTMHSQALKIVDKNVFSIIYTPFKSMIFFITLNLKFDQMNMQDFLIRHFHDCMHIEKNVAETMMKVFSNAEGTSVDRLAPRKELQSQNKLEDYHSRNDGSFHEAYWVWSREDMDIFLSEYRQLKHPLVLFQILQT